MSPVKSPEELPSRDVRNKDKIVDAKGEAEELLPAGWKMDVKVRPGSAKKKVDRTYTDPVTGYIFHSLKDVQRYLKTGEVGRLATKPKDNNFVNEDKKSHMAGQQSSSLVENRKVENSAESNSTKDACSISSPVIERFSRHKRPLEDETRSSKSGEMRKSESPLRASKRVASPAEPKTRHATKLAGIEVEASPPSLPEPKTRHATKLAGIKVEASPPSLPEPNTRQATRLSGITSPSSLPEPKTRQATLKAGIVVDASAPLPPERKTRQPSIKLDKSISSPPPEPNTREATPQTRKKNDASPPPQVKTRASTQEVDASVQPKTRQATRKAGIEIDTSAALPPERKTRQAQTKVDASLSERQQADASISSAQPKIRQARRLADASSPEPKTTPLSAMEIDAPLPEPKTQQPPATETETENRQPTQPTEMEVDNTPPSRKTRQATRSAVKPSPAVRKTRQAARQAGIKIDDPPPLPDSRTTTRRVRIAETSNNVKFDTLPIEDSKKVEAEKITSCEMQVKRVEEITINHDANADNKENTVVMPPVSQESREKLKTEEKQKWKMPPPPKQDYNEIVMGPPPGFPPITQTQHQPLPTVMNFGIQNHLEKQKPPPGFPPVAQHQPLPTAMNFGIQNHLEKQKSPPGFPPVAQHQPLPTVMNFGIQNHLEKKKSPIVVNPPVAVTTPNPQTPESSINFSLNDFWTDPCIEFAVKTLTGAIPLNDLNKTYNFAPSPLVPMEDVWTDPCIEFAVKTLTGAIPVAQDPSASHHQPITTTSDSHNLSLPDMGINFCQPNHFDTSHNKQQNSVVGNSGLQQPPNIVFPQGSTSNGQCSRPRFLQ